MAVSVHLRAVYSRKLSTTHYNNDSVYKDKKINEMQRDHRKTKVKNWGRWELNEKLDN